MLHGEYQTFTAAGALHLRGQYADGVKVGEWVDPAANGGTTVGTYVAGKQHGPWKVYNPAGKPVAVETYDHGRRHGVWTQYGPNGAVVQRDTYDDGMKTETCAAQKEGKLGCTNLVPYQLLETGCELVAGDGRSPRPYWAASSCS